MACSWSEPRSNGAQITDYRLEMGHGPTPNFTTVYQGAQTSCDVKSIPPASLCLFRVQVSGHLCISEKRCCILPYASFATETSKIVRITNRKEFFSIFAIVLWSISCQYPSKFDLYLSIQFLNFLEVCYLWKFPVNHFNIPA